MCQILGLKEAYLQYKTLQIWKEIVGDTISAVTVIERFSDGVLFIKVKNSSWRMELNFRKQNILEKLNTKLTSSRVEEIIFK